VGVCRGILFAFYSMYTENAYIAYFCLCTFRYMGVVIANAYRPGTGPIWLDNVQCVGNEKSIANCSHGDWGINNCNHEEDVSVSCGSSPLQYG